MIHAAKRCLAIAALALLTGCVASQLVSQKANPDYVGKPLKSVMVVAVTADEIGRASCRERVLTGV